MRLLVEILRKAVFFYLLCGVMLTIRCEKGEEHSTATIAVSEVMPPASEEIVAVVTPPTAKPTVTRIPLTQIAAPTPAEMSLTATTLPTQQALTLTILSEEPTVLATLTPIAPFAPLTVRRPSVDELEDYLILTQIKYIESPEKFTIAKFDDSVGRPFFFGHGEMIYKDVNADDEDDLLLHQRDFNAGGVNFLMVLLWQEGHYAQPVVVSTWNKYGGTSKLTFADWINDENDEIVWESRYAEGGSSLLWINYSTHLLHCDEECRLIWLHDYLSEEVSNPFYYRVTRFDRDITLSSEPSAITVEQNSFQLPYLQDDSSTALITHPISRMRYPAAYDGLETYVWDGTTFTLQETITYSVPTEIASMQSLTATSPFGTVTIQQGDYLTDEPYGYYLCSAEINNQLISELFKCNPWFTQVWWQDVLADDRQEIIITSVFEEYQSMLIWQQWGLDFDKLVTFEGDIINSDLFGTELQNVDNDPELEILAGRWSKEDGEHCYNSSGMEVAPNPNSEPICWREVSKDKLIFDWDGWQYILFEQ